MHDTKQLALRVERFVEAVQQTNISAPPLPKPTGTVVQTTYVLGRRYLSKTEVLEQCLEALNEGEQAQLSHIVETMFKKLSSLAAPEG